VSVSQQLVATCDHLQCENTVSRDGGAPNDTDLLSWLDSVGWIQFKTKQQQTVTGTFTFCAAHLIDLRGFFGNSLDASVGLTLVLAKIG